MDKKKNNMSEESAKITQSCTGNDCDFWKNGIEKIYNKEKLNENIPDEPAPEPPTIRQTCTGCNCVCWKYGIVKFCAEPKYNKCLICYNSECIRSKKGHKEKCSIVNF